MNYKKGRCFIHYFLLGSFAYVSVIATANVRHDYYQTIIVPSIVLALANGTLVMWNTNKRILFTRLVLFFSLIIMILSSASEIREFYKINHPEIIQAGNAAEKLVPRDELIIAPYNGDTAFLYQTGRRGWPVVDRPIQELVEKGAKYFVSVDLNHYQTVDFSKKYKVIEKTDSYVILDLSSGGEQ